MHSLNQWIGEGNIGSDIELRHTYNTNKAVTNFFLYVQDIHKTQSAPNQTNYKKTTSKIPVVAWDGKAKFIANNLSKGDRVRVVGKLKTRLVEKEDYSYNTFEVILETISLISSHSDELPGVTRQLDY
jgi:single-stranded DNA-binding protein